MPKIPVDQRNCPKAEVFWTVSNVLPAVPVYRQAKRKLNNTQADEREQKEEDTERKFESVRWEK